MFKRLPNVSVLLSGFLTAQLIASVQVYLSNREGYDRISAITQSGYETMPPGELLEMLKSWQAALGGGLFFSLSIGTGVTLLTLACLWIWKTLCAKSRAFLYLLVIIWLVILAAVNQNGLVVMPSLYFLLIPWVVCYVYGLPPRHRPNKGTTLPAICHIACIAVLALAWSTQVQSGMFITIRDNLLLGNPVGISINDFYYRYTHYSAEAISPLHNKMFKSYSLSHAAGLKTDRLESVLSDYGYLQVSAGSRKDLQIRQVDQQLLFIENKNRTLGETSTDYFFNQPAAVLKKVSQKADRDLFFRRTILFSLMIAFPITLYWLLHALLNLCLSFFCSYKKASLLSTAVCLIAGSALIIPVHWGGNRTIEMDQLPVLLSGKNSRDHVAGLKAISQNNLEIASIAPYEHLMESPQIAVQYWLARALGKSTNQETYQGLMKLLQSSHPNVVCQALYSVGQRGDRGAVGNILNVIHGFNHWYVQRYAYQALRKLGWKHKRSA